MKVEGASRIEIHGHRNPATVLMEPRVLITGSSGFIGGHVVRRVRELGWEAIGLGRRKLDEQKYVAHDLTNSLPDSLTPRPDVVIHAAALASPWGRRRDFERQNVLATKNVLDYCVRCGSPRLVFLSSSSVYYRHGHQLNVSEDTPLPDRPIHHYAATKRRAEELVQAYPGEWVTLRPRAVFGPGDTVLLPRILRAARAGRLPILTSPDGPIIGDLIYVENLVDYIVRAASDSRIHGCFNVSNNEPVVMHQFLLDVLKRLDIPAPRRKLSVRSAMLGAAMLEWFYALFLPGREPPITRFAIHVLGYSKTFDVTRMLSHMGPPRVPLSEAVDRTVEWVRSHQDG